MRLRKCHQAKEILLANPNFFINEPLLINKKWNKNIFNNKNNIELEIGMGKGQFIIKKALQNSNINYIGLELNETVCSKAIKKAQIYNDIIKNLRIINFNARDILKIFKRSQIDKIYLNFSDPWPKNRHTKNRLTNEKFLKIYKKVLKKGGLIELKTDNDSLYEYTLEVLNNNSKYKIIYSTTSLYDDINSDINKDNIATEYETKFYNKGKNINKIIFKLS